MSVAVYLHSTTSHHENYYHGSSRCLSHMRRGGSSVSAVRSSVSATSVGVTLTRRFNLYACYRPCLGTRPPLNFQEPHQSTKTHGLRSSDADPTVVPQFLPRKGSSTQHAVSTRPKTNASSRRRLNLAKRSSTVLGLLRGPRCCRVGTDGVSLRR